MSTFSRGLLIAAAATNTPYLQLTPPAGAGKGNVGITSISIVLRAATATEIGIVRAATAGTPSTSTTGVIQNDGGYDTSNPNAKPPIQGSGMHLITAWSVAPTISGSPLYGKRVALPAIAGASVTWTFDPRNPLGFLHDNAGQFNDGSLLFWNIGAGTSSAFDCTIEWNELATVSGQRFSYPCP